MGMMHLNMLLKIQPTTAFIASQVYSAMEAKKELEQPKRRSRKKL
jgi:hypothetical protein